MMGPNHPHVLFWATSLSDGFQDLSNSDLGDPKPLAFAGQVEPVT